MSSLPSFHVQNLGPIEEGIVQLHPLTILIGKNNTGKTYMAQAIYAAYKALELANGPVRPPMTLDEAYELLDRLQSESERHNDILQGSLRQKAQGWMRSRMDRAGELLKNRLAVYFDLDDLAALKRWRGKEPLDVSVSTILGHAASTHLFGLHPSRSTDPIPLPTITASQFHTSSPRHGIPSADYLMHSISRIPDKGRTEHEPHRAGRVSAILANTLSEGYFLPSIGLGGQAYYLPAGRSGLLEAWTDVVRLRLQQDRDRLALTGREPAALGGIALDFLSELQQLISHGPMRRSRYFGVTRQPTSVVEPAARHLKELIGGDIGMDPERDVPSLTYRQGKRSITVQRASSMVAEIAPLLSWITNVLVPGDLILIDEPEAHMHPEAILAVAQSLVALSQAGIKVLCTTHSADFLHQISNCMLRATAHTSRLPSIDAANLGVYRFERPFDKPGTRIERLAIDPDWGIPEDEHIAVAETLAEETADLVQTLR